MLLVTQEEQVVLLTQANIYMNDNFKNKNCNFINLINDIIYRKMKMFIKIRFIFNGIKNFYVFVAG